MTSKERSFKIRFEDVSLAEAGVKVKNLRQEILDNVRDVRVEIEKDNASTQDFGATLVLVLGTPAVVVLARGIANYLNRDRAKIRIEVDGTLIAEGISGKDAARIAEAMSSAMSSV